MSSLPRAKIVLNLLIVLVVRRGQISLSEAVKMFDLDESSLTALVRILVDKKLLSIEYTAEGERIIGKGETIAKADFIVIKKKVDEILNSITEEDLEAAKKSEEQEAKKISNSPAQEEIKK